MLLRLDLEYLNKCWFVRRAGASTFLHRVLLLDTIVHPVNFWIPNHLSSRFIQLENLFIRKKPNVIDDLI